MSSQTSVAEAEKILSEFNLSDELKNNLIEKIAAALDSAFGEGLGAKDTYDRVERIKGAI